MSGPYFCEKLVHQMGKPSLLSKFTTHKGGRAHVGQQKLMKKDVTSGQTGEVPAEDEQNDSEYLCKVNIGTPAQTLILDFDTGSSDLWVWSTELSSKVQKEGEASGHCTLLLLSILKKAIILKHHAPPPSAIFNPAKSSTWKKSSGSTWEISYGDSSSASGDVGTDVVELGGLTIRNQAVEIAKTLSAQFVSGPGDGLLGLAWGSINTVKPTPVQTPVENMISQSDIPKNMELFTAHLAGGKQ